MEVIEDPLGALFGLSSESGAVGALLVEVIDVIHKTLVTKWKSQGHDEKQMNALWNEYVANHLLPRLLIGERLTQGNADILNRMVVIDVQVTLRLDVEIDQAMTGDLVEHVVEKRQLCIECRPPAAVEIERHGEQEHGQQEHGEQEHGGGADR